MRHADFSPGFFIIELVAVCRKQFSYILLEPTNGDRDSMVKYLFHRMLLIILCLLSLSDRELNIFFEIESVAVKLVDANRIKG